MTKKFRRPRRYYALCLGTFPKEEAYRLRDTMKASLSCNVEFKLRGRGKNRPKTYVNGVLSYPYKDYLPLEMASHASIYVSVKRSLLRQIAASRVRDKILEATRHHDKERHRKPQIGSLA